MKYLSRLAEQKFLRMSQNFPVVLVTGSRQVGKTTMLEHLSDGQNRTYVTLDNLADRKLATDDPALFFQTYKPPIIIDEVQYAPNLFSQIKLISDKNKINGEFWLTGSQSYNLMRGVSESLAGRVGILEMTGFTMDEFYQDIRKPIVDFSIENLQAQQSGCKKYRIDELFSFIFGGSMPKISGADNEVRDDYYKTYVNTYLMRDVMELGKVSDIVRFYKFMTACASLISCQLNIATLANAADISEPTAKEWLSVLQGLGIVYLVQPYFNNEIKRLVKSPKLYFFDTGLAANLAAVPNAEVLMRSNLSGAYFENFVINQFVKKFLYEPKAPSVFYYRDTDQKEIDLVFENFNGLTPIEIKLTSNPHKGDVHKVSLLGKFGKPVCKGGLICTIDKPILADENNALIPFYLL